MSKQWRMSCNWMKHIKPKGGGERKHVGDAMADIIKRAEAMRKKLQAENETCQVTLNEYKCATCQDTEVLFYEEVNEFGMKVSVQKDCSCKVRRVIERRLKNAMIPEEFAQARFDSYKQKTENQKCCMKPS